MISLSIVVPCFNEEEVLIETSGRLLVLVDDLQNRGWLSADSEIIFVDDGSGDRTWELIKSQSEKDHRIRGVKLSRNRGHQNALLAGLMSACGDAIVSIDADLQDDVDAISMMVERHLQGADIVYGVRTRRNKDTWFKRTSAEAFYRMMNWLGAEAVNNHADFRLLSRRALEALRSYSEVNLFLRGLIPLLGFRSAVVEYERKERFAGASKYPLRKMLAFALEGITSFSVFPLRIITVIGFVVFAFTIAVSAWVLWVRLFSDRAVPGWASTVLAQYFIGGIQILCLGVIGEYLGKVYQEVKHRPRFTIEEYASFADDTISSTGNVRLQREPAHRDRAIS